MIDIIFPSRRAVKRYMPPALVDTSKLPHVKSAGKVLNSILQRDAKVRDYYSKRTFNVGDTCEWVEPTNQEQFGDVIVKHITETYVLLSHDEKTNWKDDMEPTLVACEDTISGRKLLCAISQLKKKVK